MDDRGRRFVTMRRALRGISGHNCLSPFRDLGFCGLACAGDAKCVH